MKKSFIVGLASTVVLGLATTAFAAGFSDMNSHWAKDYVNKLVDLKVVNGVSDTTFNPDGKVTRAEFAKMIVNAKGLALVNPATPTFSDVPATAWFFPYVEAAAKAGYINGTGEGKFDPNALVTREQVAKMIVLAAGKTADTSKAVNFDDATQISDWAKGYVAVAADLKLVEGYNNKFSPKNNATRAEAAKLTFSEMVYEGKIAQDEVVAADLMTEINDDSLEIGGKTYDLAPGAEFMVGDQLVNKDALVENTKVKFETNAAGKITKVTVGAPDYTFVKGEVTEVGEDNTDPYVVVDGKKVYVDVEDEDYYSTSIDEDDVVAPSANNPGVMPTLNKDYLIVYNSSNYATYAEKLATNNTSGILDSKSEDKDGKYLVIDGKKYYFNKDGSNYDVDVMDSNPVVAFDVDGQDYTDLSTGDRIEFDTNSDNEITSLKTSSVDLEGITKTPMYQLKAGNTYNVWLPVIKKASDNFDKNVVVYIHTTSDDTALRDMITDGDVLVAGAPAAGSTIIELDTDAHTYVNGVKTELYDVTRARYAVIDLNDDTVQKVSKVSVTTKAAVGLVESIEKSSDKVTAVTINGTKYTYDGKSNKYESTTKGKVSIRDVGTGDQTIEVGYYAVATLNADGKIVSFTTLADTDSDKNDIGLQKVTVTAKAGTTSHFSKDEDGSKTVNVPVDTVEVQLEDGTYAWVTFDKDTSDDTKTTISVKGAGTIDGFAVGDTAYVVFPDKDNINWFDTTKVDTTSTVKYDKDAKKLTITPVGGGLPTTYTSNVAKQIFAK